MSYRKTEIIKVIDYAPIVDTGNYIIYNLAFGDYDEENDLVIDKTNSNNGDMYPVFYTVLNSITEFFKKFPTYALFVQGSDNSPDYFNECVQTCQKRCIDNCRNANRRIKTYSRFVNKNF